MNQLDICPADDEDREWVAALLAGSEPWKTLGATIDKCRASCHDPEYLVYVARSDGRRCGGMVIHPRGLASSPYVKSVAIAEGSRSRGFGAQLLDFAENLFRGKSRHIFLCVSSFNTRARAFYERRGYFAVGELADYIIEGASETILCKRLG